MKKSRFTESRIVAVLKEGDAGVPVAQLVRKHGINSATYYTWRSKYAGGLLPNPSRLSRRTIDEMATSGRTDIVRSNAAKDELAGIVALAEWRGQGFDQSSRMTEHYRQIIEERVRYDLGQPLLEAELRARWGVTPAGGSFD